MDKIQLNPMLTLEIINTNIESLKNHLQQHLPSKIVSCIVEPDIYTPQTFSVTISFDENESSNMVGYIHSYGESYGWTIVDNCRPLFAQWVRCLVDKNRQTNRTNLYKQELLEKFMDKIDSHPIF
jgi:hypothetical protein